MTRDELNTLANACDLLHQAGKHLDKVYREKVCREFSTKVEDLRREIAFFVNTERDKNRS